tara:strand:+ start:53 stop:952 length:900 start_codon:yes stop_codon:yes gene_type:complete
MAKDNYIIFNPEGGLGKIIASTAVIKNIQEKYPEHKIIVLTPWPEVFLNNPRVYRVFKSGNTPYFYRDYLEGRESIVLKGEPYFNTNHLYGKNHLIQSWCELYDLPFDGNIKPELYFTAAEQSYYATNLSGDKPLLVMQTTGGSYVDEKQYSWTRDLPQQQAQILADNLSQKFKIIHISRKNGYQLNNVHRVDEVQNKRTFMSILLRSEKRLLIDSCLQHAAAAFDLPSTVCWIGTSPTVFGYKTHTNILPNKDKQISGGGYMIDSLFFDYDFNSPEYEYPYDDFDIFNLQTVYDSIVK